METTVLDAENTTSEKSAAETIDQVFDGILQVFGFFRTIIDAIKEVLTPIWVSLLQGVIG